MVINQVRDKLFRHRFYINRYVYTYMYIHTQIGVGLPWWFKGKEWVCDVGNANLIPRQRRSPGKGNGNPLQYSFLENPMDRGSWWATVHGVAKESDTT